MKQKYERRHIAEYILALAGQIHPSYCIGRVAENLNDSTKETFAHAFFVNASTEELKTLWEFAEKEADNNELLLSFSLENNDLPRSLTNEEMKNFDFSKHSWRIQPIAPTEDELREIPQTLCLIIFSAK